MNSNTTPEDPTPVTTAIPPGSKTRQLRSLLEIVHDIKHILETSQGEVTKELDELDLEIEVKVEAYAAVMRELEAQRVAHTNLSKFYATQSAFREHDIERLKTRLEQGMRVVGIDDIRTKTAHAWFRTDKAIEVNKKLFLERYRDDLEHQDLLRFSEPEPNKTAIKKKLDANEPVEHVTTVVRSSLQFK